MGRDLEKQTRILAPNPHLRAKALTSDQRCHSVPRWDASSTDLLHSRQTLREQGPGPRPHTPREGRSLPTVWPRSPRGTEQQA